MVKQMLLVCITSAACGLSSAPNPSTNEKVSSLIQPPGPVRRPCNRTTSGCVDLYVVAHPDDDLLFMNPDIQTSISAGNRVVVVVENGSDWDQSDPNRLEASQYWIDRERGNLNAYAFMAQGRSAAFDHYIGFTPGNRSSIPSDYTQSQYCAGGSKNPVNCRDSGGVLMPEFDIATSAGSSITLLYLHLRDEYVIDLWADPTNISPIHPCPNPDDSASVCMGLATFVQQDIMRSQLLGFYEQVMTDFSVTSVSTLDTTNIYIDATNPMLGWGTQGARSGYAENENHIYSGMFALTAATNVQATTNRTISVRSYRGYSTSSEKLNLDPADNQVLTKEDAFAYYAMFDSAALDPSITGEPADPTPADPTDAPKLPTPSDYFTNRNYLFRSPPTYIETEFYGIGDSAYGAKKYVTRTVLGTGALTGRLRKGDGSCLYATPSNTAVSLASCATSPSWTITEQNQIQLAGTNQCLNVTFGSSSGNYYSWEAKQAAEAVTLTSCNANRAESTMFLFGNGQVRTPNGRCLTYDATATSDDCMPWGGGPITVASATASSIASRLHSAGAAIDASSSTYWQSSTTASPWTTQWLQLDLGSVHSNLAGLDITWTAYASSYEVDVSDDGSTWTTAFSVNDFNGNYGGLTPGVEFANASHGRYIRINCLAHGSGTTYEIANVTAYDHVKAMTPPDQDWTLMFDEAQLISTQFSNSTEVGTSSVYYKTLGVVNHDVCVRRTDGVECSEWNGSTLDSPYLVSSGFSDGWGWNAPQNGDTVRGVWFGADGWPPVACGLSIYGPTCSNGLSSTDYADFNSADDYYETIRFTDLDNDGAIDVCGRGYGGIYCTTGLDVWGSADLWTTDFGNEAGWDDISNAATIQFGDIDGDGVMDVCGRSDYGMYCDTNVGYGASFANGHLWSFNSDRTYGILSKNDFSDYDTVADWSSSAYYNSIRLIDINRDGFVDVCGRGPEGVYCALSTGTSFETKRLIDQDLTDTTGWEFDDTGGTITFGDLDGDQRVDMCMRGYAGLYCEKAY